MKHTAFPATKDSTIITLNMCAAADVFSAIEASHRERFGYLNTSIIDDFNFIYQEFT